MRFYFAGQTDFGNRGCEALIRSIVDTVQELAPHAQFLVPSQDQAADKRQWPTLPARGAQFVDTIAVPPGVKWWNRLATRVPPVRGLWEPSCRLADGIRQDVASCDAVIMTGGDIISLDYGPGSLFKWSTFMDAAARMGKPTILYAASVGPFKDPVFEQFMLRHLARYSLITVRETASYQYLKKLGVDKVTLVADPAFRLAPEPTELPKLFDGAKAGVLGFNLSPLVAESWKNHGNQGDLAQEAIAFLTRVLRETQLSVMLVPHVDPLNTDSGNSDSAYMSKILSALKEFEGRVDMLKPGLNAAQLKYLIGRCRLFIGARTHATVAAWSQSVPTVSIAYSVKARGLNQDLFGSLEYVLETPKTSAQTLWTHLEKLQVNEAKAREMLDRQIPVFKQNASISASMLLKHLGAN